MSEAPATVLVADDSEAKRYLLASWLRGGGHRVVEAATGQEALDRLAGIDLVVLDVRLPDLSGTEVCARIKSDPATAAIPVIQVSAIAVAVADRALGLNEGADAYLAEPFQAEEFLATVTATLRYFRARRQAERAAARLTALTQVTLAMNAAETFDRLARTAAQGAAEIFGAPAGLLLVRAAPTPSLEAAPFWGLGCGAAAGAVLGVLAAFSGGPLGNGRLAAVGPSGWQVALVAALEIGIASAITAGVANWIRLGGRPRARRFADASAAAAPAAATVPGPRPGPDTDGGHTIYLNPWGGDTDVLPQPQPRGPSALP